MANLTAPHFKDADAARVYLEGIRWKDGTICPHCGTVGHSYETKRGIYRCAEPECRKDFSVTVGTIFERSKIPLHKWLMASYLLCSSKKGISSHQLHRMLGVTYKSAWFMTHRIREAMKDGSGPLGGPDKVVEADETYYGPKKEKATKTTSGRPFTRNSKSGRGVVNKRAVVSLVERGGKVRSFHVDRADKVTVARIVVDNVARESKLHTDESKLYTGADGHVSEHHTVHHAAKEYVRGTVHTNTIEGYFSIFKRGMKGVYQHCDEKHLHRYLTEFDFRYNAREALGVSDDDRAVQLLNNIAGKRLTYRTVGRRKVAA